jgi:hypothetical protein
MPKPQAVKPERNYSNGYALLQAEEPLPPYELDPHFDEPAVRKRIGDLIARPTVLGHFKPEFYGVRRRSRVKAPGRLGTPRSP